jgi:hypothetical protein
MCWSITFRAELFSGEHYGEQALERTRGRSKVVKFVKVFLSLYSIQLIFISALLMTYLSVTATTRTETANGNVAVTDEENARVAVAETESLGGQESSTGN